MITEQRKQAISDFEDMLETAELKALSKVSLERPLSTEEYDKMKDLAYKIYGG